MRIINRRSQIETVIAKEEWDLMVKQQTSQMFKILDKSDTQIQSKINIPKVIEEFRVSKENLKDLKIETTIPDFIQGGTVEGKDLKIEPTELYIKPNDSFNAEEVAKAFLKADKALRTKPSDSPKDFTVE